MKKLVILLAISFCTLAQAELLINSNKQVTHIKADLKAEIVDVDISKTVVVKFPHLLTDSDTKILFHSRALGFAESIRNGNFICEKLGFGKYVPDSLKKGKMVFKGLIAYSNSGEDLFIEEIKDYVEPVETISCLK